MCKQINWKSGFQHRQRIDGFKICKELKKNVYILKAKTGICSIVRCSADVECVLSHTAVRRARHGVLSSVCFIPAF